MAGIVFNYTLSSPSLPTHNALPRATGATTVILLLRIRQVTFPEHRMAVFKALRRTLLMGEGFELILEDKNFCSVTAKW